MPLKNLKQSNELFLRETNLQNHAAEAQSLYFSVLLPGKFDSIYLSSSPTINVWTDRLTK